jgi:beta-galactosidase
VKVDASKFEGWFYEGAGIYRHVWLDKTAPVAIAPDGIFVYSYYSNNLPEGDTEIVVQTKMIGFDKSPIRPLIRGELLDPNAKLIATTTNRLPVLNQGGNNSEYIQFSIFDLNPLGTQISPQQKADMAKDERFACVNHNSEFWSPESPKLYKLITTVEVGGKIIDRKETEFGIRTFAFDKDKGFLLNGQPYELKGTCNHQDMAGVGAALPDAVQYFRIAKLKEFGDNALRTSHNPPTPELLDACDHLGMIVMDESRLLGSDAQNLQKWNDQIHRDRNHASVGIWSIANEEFAVQDTPQAGNVARTMQNLVKSLDPTRPVTYAAPVGDDFQGINSVIEVRGWNYHPGGDMDKYHAEHPDQPNVGTEQASTVSTRGIYTNDAERGYVSAYDDNAPPWAQTAETWWSYFADRPWLSGGFVWTGFDYRGEPTPYAWPCINSHFGILDVCGFPKDNFYYYQSWWTTNTVLHLLPHWNWPGKEGQEIRVDALSNCKQVELFLNGASLGRQTMKPNSKLSWQVKYAPGTLSAKGYNTDGKVIAETKVETTGAPAAVQLTPDRTAINADGEDVSVFTVAVTDQQGRVVPAAGNKISFALEGAGKILGVGNGDPSCHEPDTFVSPSSVKTIPFNDWRWNLVNYEANKLASAKTPEYAVDLDDSAWNQTSSENENSQLSQNQSAVFRQHIQLTANDLAGADTGIYFGRIDDFGWIFVNGQPVGESHDWQDSPSFDLKKYLHEGNNVIAVGVRNEASGGGLTLGANLQLVSRPAAPPAWSRSTFNGLAQVIVQSTKEAGEIKLTATAENLQSATTIVTTQAATPRPSVP